MLSLSIDDEDADEDEDTIVESNGLTFVMESYLMTKYGKQFTVAFNENKDLILVME